LTTVSSTVSTRAFAVPMTFGFLVRWALCRGSRLWEVDSIPVDKYLRAIYPQPLRWLGAETRLRAGLCVSQGLPDVRLVDRSPAVGQGLGQLNRSLVCRVLGVVTVGTKMFGGRVGGPTHWHRIGGTASWSCRAGAHPSWRVSINHRRAGRRRRRLRDGQPSRRPGGGLSQFLCRSGTEFPYQIATERGGLCAPYW